MSSDGLNQEDTRGFPVQVAVIDVLGFKAFPAEVQEDFKKETAFHCRPFVHMGGRQPPLLSGTPITYVEFTDAIIITRSLATGDFGSEDGFYHALWFVSQYMMRKGWLVRGGVSIAPSRQEAIEHAWSIEQNTSLPRIEFGPDGVYIANNRADRTIGRGRDFGIVRTERKPRKIFSFDFLRFIGLWPTGNAEEETGRMTWQLELTRPVIVQNLARFAERAAQSSEEGRKTFNKYKWYANYFNEVAHEINVERIVIPSVSSLTFDDVRKRSRGRRCAKKMRGRIR